MSLTACSDAELATSAANGDRLSFEELHRRYRSLIANVVRSEMRASGDTDDVAQEAFARAWTKLSSLRDPALFRPWLLQITRRAIIDHRRHTSRRPVLVNDDDLALDHVADSVPGPDDLAELQDLAAQVSQGIKGLSRRDATALSMAVHFGFGPTEIGEALGITAGNAKVVLHRARKRLRDNIESMDTGPMNVTESTV